MDPLTGTGLLLLATGVLLLVALVVSPLSGRLGLPSLFVFLLIGIAFGSEGFGGIPFDDYALAFRVGTIGLVLILFDGGLNAPTANLRGSLGPAIVLASGGVLLTAVVVAGAGLLLGLPPPVALLLGAVVSSTDAAAVFAVLRAGQVRLKAWTARVLELESGLNDPMAVLLTLALTEWLLGTSTEPIEAIRLASIQFGVGIVSGLGFGYASVWLLRAIPLPVAGLYPVLTTAIAFTSYGVATALSGSGFLAVYLAALVIARSSVPYRAGIRRVHDALAWLSQLLMFLVLGLLVFPSKLVPMAPLGFALALILALVARPLAVWLCLLANRVPWRDKLFVSWIGLRGAVPIILAMYPVLRGVEGSDALFHLVFFSVLVNGVVPGATVPWTARLLGQAEEAPPPAPARLELVSLRDYAGSFLWYRVGAASAVAGVPIRDLPLTQSSLLVLLLRDEHVLAPRGETVLTPGDYVCVFTTADERPYLDLIFGQPASDGA